MTIALGVDTLHLAAEERAVGGGVSELADGDVVVNHLVQDSVLYDRFGEVDACVDTQHEVRIAVGSEEGGAPSGEGEFAEEAFGVAQPDRYGRQFGAEETGVVVVEAGLYVGYGGAQGGVKSCLKWFKVV